MSQEWTALVRQLCTPNQQRAVAAIASARSTDGPGESMSTAQVAELARRFGLSSGDADVWARSAAGTSVRMWPGGALDLVAPDGLFEEIGLDDTVAVVERLARAIAEDSKPSRPLEAQRSAA